VKSPSVASKVSSSFSTCSAELEAAVIQYYLSDSISRVMPGKADVVTVCSEDGSKQKLQKRHLVMTVGECYQTFKVNHPQHVIGLSKFASLRPKNCFLESDMLHNVCGCKYRSNIILLLESLHQKVPDVPVYSSEFINYTVRHKKHTKILLCITSRNINRFPTNRLLHVPLHLTDVAALPCETIMLQKSH